MIIYNNNGVPIIDVEVDDISYRFRQIMGRDEVLLEFSLAEHVELPVGAYLMFENDRYDLLKEENVTINHSRNYEYKITFSGPGERARNYIIHNVIDKRLKFDLTAKPSDHLAMIVANMNERDGAGVWSVGACIDKKEMTISYNHTYCIDGLSQLADECDTEYEIVRLSGSTYAINLGKVEYHKSNPLSLGYGKENGFVPGVSRESSSAALEKVWIEGGDRNISLKSYGASTLHLPENLSFSFDGTKFSGETGYDSSKGVSMATDAEGYSVRLASASVNATEGSLDVTGIYPKRIGEVSALRFEYNNWYYTYAELIAAFPSLTDEDWDSVQVDIVDSGIPASLDYSECLMVNDQPLTVIFQSGALAGREFDATFQKEAKTDTRTTEHGTETVTRPANRFELKKADHDGVNMPTRNYLPAVDDEYTVVNCIMPEAYISDPDSFGGAEYDALREAAAYLYENKDKTRSYRGTIDGLFAKRNWLNVSSHLKLGSYVSFSHPQVQATPISVRILACKQYINKPHKPEIEISNEIVSVGKSTTIQEAVNQQAHVEALNNAARRFSRRGFRDAKETAEMLIDAALEGFDPAISPIAIQTMQLLAGDESLQFKFWTSRACTTAVLNPVYYDSTTKQVKADACVLQHMTLGIDSVSPSHQLTEYKIWNMSAYESAVLAEPQKKYYVYAKVDSANDGTSHLSGSFVMSETAIGMRSVVGYYHLLVGMLMSEKENDRSFAPMFGFTEILPGQIMTDLIRSSNGLNYFDLLQNRFKIGNSSKYLAWNLNGDGILRLKGNIVQSPSGDEFPVPCNRGAWITGTSSGYYGDMFSFNGQTWICVDPTAVDSSHAVTTDPGEGEDEWMLYAKKGEDGQGEDGHSPYIGENGNWFFWQNNAWVDSGLKAEGDDGHSPYVGVNGYWYEWNNATKQYEQTAYEAQGESIQVQWSVNGSTNWHSTYQSGDQYMRQRIGTGSWSAAIKAVGEEGDTIYKSFVFKASENQPATPTGTSPVPSGWSPAPPAGGGGGGSISNFSFQGIDAGNWPVSGSNPYVLTSVGIDHSYSTWEKISFYATAGAILHLKITAYSEADYDKGYITALDDSTHNINNALAIVSGDGVSETIDVNIPTTGNHFICVGYVKDGSQSLYGDYVKVEVSDGSSSGGTNVWMSSSQVTNGVSDGNWSAPIMINGTKGDIGDSGPACPFIGEYDSTKEYFGTSVRTDVVHYNNRYYKARASVGSSFVNKLPTNTTYWDDFGASFDSIATGFFFTEEAVIENAVVRKLRTNESGKRIVAENNVLSMFDETEQRLVISGEEMQDLPSSKSVSIQSLTAFSVVKSNVNLNTPQSNNGVSSGVAFTCEEGAVLTIPATTVYFTAALTGASGSGIGTMYCEASWQIDGTRIGTKTTMNTNYPTSQSANVTLDALTITLGAGTHNIRLYASVVAGCAYTASQFNSNAYNVATTAQISYSHQKTEVAANGFRVIFGDSNYMLQAIKAGSSQSSVEFIIRAGSYGIRVNDTGLKKTTNGGSTWTDI